MPFYFFLMFSENDRKVPRALFLAPSNCLCFYLLCLPAHKPAEEAGIGDTPNLEDQAAGHVTQGQSPKLPAKPWGWEAGDGKSRMDSTLKRESGPGP